MALRWFRLLIAAALLPWCAAARGQDWTLSDPTEFNLSLPVAADLAGAAYVLERALEQQDWERAVDLLQMLLDAPEDSFSAPDRPTSLRGRIETLWRAAPMEARRLYERRSAAPAEALLDAGLAAADWEPIREAARRFPFTSAGRRALWRLAIARHGQGHFLSAALLYERLLEQSASLAEFGPELQLRAAVARWGAADAAAAVTHARALRDAGPLTVAGRRLEVPAADAGLEDWLARLTGAPPQSGSIPAPAPASPGDAAPRFDPLLLRPDWSAPPLDVDDAPYPDRVERLTELLQGMQARFRSTDSGEGRLLVPAATPLVVGERVVIRGPDKVRSLHLSDGRLDWPSVRSDATFRELAASRDFPDREQLTRELFLGQRAWRDRTSASLSSDGQRVYAVADAGMLGAVDPAMPFLVGTARTAKGPLRENSLQAYQLRGGKLHWSIGGPRGAQEDDFAGLFFLGAPLPGAGVLYCLVEDRGQVRLLALDPSPSPRPTLLWSQALLNVPPEMSIELDEARRTAAFSPVAVGGVLLCPLGAGHLVAFDVEQRRLLWAARYQPPADPRTQAAGIRNLMRQRQNAQTQQRQALDRLLDAPHWRCGSRIEIDQGVAVVAAPEAYSLIGIRVADGAMLWRRPAQRWLALAGVHAGRALLLGEQHVEAVSVHTGEPAWAAPIPLPALSGTGVLVDGRYTLPLSTGEVATIDVAAGRLLARSPLPDGRIPGNLVLTGERLIEQSADGVRAAAPLSRLEHLIAELLEVDPSDPQALAWRGELQMHAGDVAGGRDDLRLALQAGPDPRLHKVLAASLLDDLRIDFTASAVLIAEIEPLVAGTPEEVQLRRLAALGWQQQGDFPAAFEQYLRLAALTTRSTELESLEPDLAVGADRWVEAQLRDLLTRAAPPQRAAMLTILRDRLTAASSVPPQGRTEQSLHSLLRLTDGTELAPAALLVAARTSGHEAELRQEWLWLQVAATAEPPQQREAAARLAELYLRAKNSAALAPLWSRLQGELADLECLAGKTGRQLTADWEADPRNAFTLAAATIPDWPDGPVTVTRGEGDLPVMGRAVPVIGPVVGPLAGWSFRLDERQQRLSAFTPHGRFGWEVSLGQGTVGDQAFPRGVMIVGHLMMVLFDERFLMVNALDAASVRFRQRSGEQRLADDSASTPPFGRIAGPGRNRSAVGVVGPLRVSAVVFHRGDELTALDPWTMRPIWKRSHPEGVARILADDEYVVVVPYGRGDLLVLRSLDGSVVARRPLPPDLVLSPEPADWGRLMFFLSLAARDDALPPESPPPLGTSAGRRVAGMFDPVTGEFAWRREFQGDVWWGTIDGGTLGVVDGQGEFHFIDPQTGRSLFQHTLLAHSNAASPDDRPAVRPDPDPVAAGQAEPPPAGGAPPPVVDSLTLLADDERVFVVLNRPQEADVMQFNRQQTAERPVNGRLHAFDRASGRLLWSREIRGQYLHPQMPARWPFLVLSAVQSRPGEAEPRHQLLLLDRQSGDVLAELSEPAPTLLATRLGRATAWTVDPEQPIARLWYGRTVVMVQSGATAPDDDSQ